MRASAAKIIKPKAASFVFESSDEGEFEMFIDSLSRDEVNCSTLVVRNFDDFRLGELLSVLETNKKIQNVKLEGFVGEMSDETAANLTTLLEKNRSLRGIHLAAATIPEESAELVVEALAKNPAIQDVALKFDRDEISEMIKSVTKRNKELSKGMAFLLQEEFFKQIEDKRVVEMINAHEVNIQALIKSALSEDGNVSFQVLYSALDTIYENLRIKHQLSSGDLTLKKALLEAGTLIKDFQKMMNKLLDFSVEADWNLLHFAATNGVVSHIPKLMELKFSLDSCDVSDRTPLFTAALAGMLSSVKTLVAHGADVEKKDSQGKSAMQAAMENNHPEIADFLEQKRSDKKGEHATPTGLDASLSTDMAAVPKAPVKDKKADLELAKTLRRFYQVHGGKKVAADLPEGTTAETGSTYEGYETLIYNLEKYIAKCIELKQVEKVEKLQTILATLKSSAIAPPGAEYKESKSIFEAFQRENQQDQKAISGIIETLSKARAGARLIVDAGHVCHAIGALLEKKENGRYELDLADRGGSLNFSEREGGKFASIKTLNFQASLLPAVLTVLFESQHLPKDKAVEKLEKTLPRLTFAKFKENLDISQSPFKAPICYYANSKTILFDLIVKEFGIKDGRKIYKEFSTDSRETLAVDLAKYKGPDHQAVQTSETIVAKRRAA